MPPPAVSVVTVQPRPTAVIAQTTSWSEFPGLWGRLLDEVYRFVRASPDFATLHGPDVWQNVMLYEDDRPAVEVGVLAPLAFSPQGRVVASELPAGRVARAVHRGDYARLGETHDAVVAYADAHGLVRAGSRWEIYGHWREDPSELETEVYWLLG
jgi:effector-binding domain-containing protein